MNPPIVLLNRGDVQLYASAKAVEIHVELIDVLNGEYEVYDSTGSLLNFGVGTTPRWWGESQIIKLTPSPPELVHPLELRLALLGFFIHNPNLGEAHESLFNCSLSELIDKVKKKVGVSDGQGRYTRD